jgi:SAM-dependent methyltransferase
MMTSADTASEPVLPGTPCQNPCDSPCGESADQNSTTVSQPETWMAKWMKASLFNTLDLCFDHVYQEPKSILIVGGCRQVSLAQHIALLLPSAEITLVDPCPDIAQRAKAEICCRFKFIDSPLEALPFENNAFDLTLAHNYFAYPAVWQQGFAELYRVTRTNVFFSINQPFVWWLMGALMGGQATLDTLGIQLPGQLPENDDLMKMLAPMAKISAKWSPLPWKCYMTQVKPAWNPKTVLS